MTPKSTKVASDLGSSESWLVTNLSYDRKREASRRRLEYVLIFRIALLTLLAFLVNLIRYLSESVKSPGVYDVVFWSVVASGYFLTFVSARRIRKDIATERLAWEQLLSDIFISTLVVQLSGGAESAFVFFYLIAILGSAITGGRKQTLVAGGSSAIIYSIAAALHVSGWSTPLALDGQPASISSQIGWTVGRNLAAILTLGALASYLAQQLSRSTRQLGSLKALNENIVRSLSSGLMTLDLNGRISFANPTAQAILGKSVRLIGANCNDIFPGVLDHCRSQPIQQNPTRFEVHLEADKNHPERHIGLSSCPLVSSTQEQIGYLVNFQDVSLVRKLELDLRRKERLAEIGSLAATVAHEVRNPLAAISGCAELLSQTNENPEDSKLLEVISRESSRLDQTVSSLLNFTRPAPLNFQPVELRPLLEGIVTAAKNDPKMAKVEFVFRCAPEATSMSLTADPDQLSQVFWNLLRNGADAMEYRGRLELDLRMEEKDISLKISDQGSGIPEENLLRIFEPFFTTKTHGSGIGLALVKRVIEDHSGSIAVASEHGQGTTFKIRLPKQQDSIYASTRSNESSEYSPSATAVVKN